MSGNERRRLYGVVATAVLNGRTPPPGAFPGGPRQEPADFVLELAAFDGWLPVLPLAKALHVDIAAIRCATSGRPDTVVLAEGGLWA